MQAGAHIGHYEVVSAIGRGGMGEVWKARDTKLRRDVALKTLPPEFSSAPDRLARLEREAMLLASLSHPNIAAIHGLEQEQGAHVLVLELVEGRTLAERLLRGPLPVDEALKNALQIAEALEAAHEKGVIHRDLKPANIKLTPEGRVKVLDFGLAKTVAPTGVDVPTQTGLDTELGTVMGTPAYMSPEQARGESTGRQADVWAFGVVLFEMLAGVSPFASGTTAETLARVLGSTPDYSTLPSTVPSVARRLLKRCLEKDPKRRFQHSGDLRLEVEEALAASTAPSDPAEPGVRRARPWQLAWIAAGFAAVGISVAVAAWSLASRSDAGAEAVRLSISSLPPRAGSPTGAQHVALSRDGTRIAYAGESALLIRQLRDRQAVAVPAQGVSPFFSPDGAWVGYAWNGLWKVPSSGGGAPVMIASSTERPAGAAWDVDGTIVFATTSGLYRVAENGGEPQLLARPDPQRGEQLYAWPEILPNGRGLLFTIKPRDERAAAQIAWLDPDTRETRVLLTGGSAARYVATGHLVYAAGTALTAIAFDLDARATRGEPVVIRDVAVITAADNGAAEFAIATNGTLAFIAPIGQERFQLSSLIWVDRDGNEEPLSLAPGRYIYPRVSPDGTRVALDVPGLSGNRDIWIWDLRRLSFTRLTDGPSEDMTPYWSVDGRRVFFASDRTGNIDLYSQAADGSTAATVELATPRSDFPNSPLPDGRRWLVTQDFRDTNLFDPDRSEVVPLLEREADDWNAEVSADGRWLLFESNEAGPQFEIFIRPFPDIGSRREKVSIDGGRYPRWGPPGSGELYYVDLMGGMMAVPVQTSPDLTIGSPRKLFGTSRPPPNISSRPYDVSRVDGRFIVTRLVDTAGAGTTNVDVVLNWFTDLRAQLAAR